MNSSTITSNQQWDQVKFGSWIAILTSLFSAISLVIGIFTPVRSGPYCEKSCISYPYTEAANFYPRDYYWMYSAIILVISYLILVNYILQYSESNMKLYNRIGLSFALISSIVLLIDYFVQLTVVVPSLNKGETNGISLLTMYNPHGLFLALEDIGYLMMSFSFLFIGLELRNPQRLGLWIKGILIISFVLTILALLSFSISFGDDFLNNFELAALTIDWVTLIIIGPIFAKIFTS